MESITNLLIYIVIHGLGFGLSALLLGGLYMLKEHVDKINWLIRLLLIPIVAIVAILGITGISNNLVALLAIFWGYDAESNIWFYSNIIIGFDNYLHFKEVKKIMEKSGLEGIFKDFDPKVQDAIADSMRNILTQELKGLTPEEQIKKLKKMYTPTMKGGRKRRRKRTRKRRKSRRKSRRKLRRKSRRRKT